MLSSMGVTAVHNAGSSAEVLRQVKAHSFDIILSDYQLEDGRDGQQLLEELRQQHLVPLSTVFFIITSERAYHNVVSVAELAPDDYLIKPFTADELHGRLVRALYKKQFFAQLYEHLDNGAFRPCTGHLRASARAGQRLSLGRAASQGGDAQCAGPACGSATRLPAGTGTARRALGTDGPGDCAAWVSNRCPKPKHSGNR
jgi:DNA-binding response OmpR family regulator